MTAMRPPIAIALHSSAAGARQWASYQTLIDPAWHWMPIDLLGYEGATAWPIGGVASLQAEAQHVRAAVDDLSTGPIHVVGHSYGGAVALQLALNWPERVASLTLYEPVRFALLQRFDSDAWREIVTAGRRVGMLALGGRLHESAQMFVDYWSGAGVWQRLSAARQDAIARRMPKVQAEFEALFEDAAPTLAFGAMAMPVRVACGTASPAPTRRVAERLASLPTRAALIQWPAPITWRPGASRMICPSVALLGPRGATRAAAPASSTARSRNATWFSGSCGRPRSPCRRWAVRPGASTPRRRAAW